MAAFNEIHDVTPEIDDIKIYIDAFSDNQIQISLEESK